MAVSRDLHRDSNVLPLLDALGPPVVWSVHLVACYLLASWDGGRASALVLFELTAVTIAGLALVVPMGLAGTRLTQETGANGPGLRRFLGRFAAWNAVLFGLAILLTAWPAYLLAGAGRG